MGPGAGRWGPTGYIGRVFQLVVWAAMLRAPHEVGWFVHVLQEKLRIQRVGLVPRGQGDAGTGAILTIHMSSKGTWAWNSDTMSCHQSRASGLVKSGKAVGPGHTWTVRGQRERQHWALWSLSLEQGGSLIISQHPNRQTRNSPGGQ